eukprot:2382643-Rhodomonas_salina.2
MLDRARGRTSRSLSLSKALVASSRMRMAGFLMIARAMASRCRCLPAPATTQEAQDAREASTCVNVDAARTTHAAHANSTHTHSAHAPAHPGNMLSVHRRLQNRQHIQNS